MILMQNTHFIQNIKHRLSQEAIFKYRLCNMHNHTKLNPVACFILVKLLVKHQYSFDYKLGSLTSKFIVELANLGLIKISLSNLAIDYQEVHCVLTHFGFLYTKSIFKHPLLVYYLNYVVNLVFEPLPFLLIGWCCSYIWAELDPSGYTGPASLLFYLFGIAPLLVSNAITVKMYMFFFNYKCGFGSNFVFSESRLSKSYFINFCYHHGISFINTHDIKLICDRSLFTRSHSVSDFWRRLIISVISATRLHS